MILQGHAVTQQMAATVCAKEALGDRAASHVRRVQGSNIYWFLGILLPAYVPRKP